MKTKRLDDYYTVYSDSQGMGYIIDDGTDINDFIIPEPVTIAGETIKPGDFTTLQGYLIRPVKYIGLHCENRKQMIFHYGTSNDLFPLEYYGVIAIITENRIFEMFSNIGGRDHIFINGTWK